jgi:plastocyanin
MITALLVAAALGTGHADAVKVSRWHQPVCRRCTRRRHRLKALRPAPVVIAPTPGNPAPTPTPAPPRYPSRTSVDLDEWRVTPSYRTLAAGTVEFNAANLGEDDHDFSVRAGDVNLVTLPLPLEEGGTGTVRLVMGPGTYTLYCSLPTHEEMGMKTDVTVR